MLQRKLLNAPRKKCLLVLVGIGMHAMLPGNVVRAELTSSCWAENEGKGCCVGWSKTLNPEELCQKLNFGYQTTPKGDDYSFQGCHFWSGCIEGQDPIELSEGRSTEGEPALAK